MFFFFVACRLLLPESKDYYLGEDPPPPPFWLVSSKILGPPMELKAPPPPVPHWKNPRIFVDISIFLKIAVLSPILSTKRLSTTALLHVTSRAKTFP